MLVEVGSRIPVLEVQGGRPLVEDHIKRVLWPEGKLKDRMEMKERKKGGDDLREGKEDGGKGRRNGRRGRW